MKRVNMKEEGFTQNVDFQFIAPEPMSVECVESRLTPLGSIIFTAMDLDGEAALVAIMNKYFIYPFKLGSF